MKIYFEEICTKLKNEIEVENIEIVDNSNKHKGHKFYSPEKFHLKLKIKSLYLNSLSRVNAQKMIMKILRNDLKTKIHALEISIEK
ncbi:BolA family transcriptional regulator [Candidatus Pelagibacter bacterium]|jgi:BolA protein|nr:BolA family transcriptional regulator [Candidatus Pelagibacter bacterium]|tara:strand:- start:2685 stop:2942 length:258 start_codon:yes stop_codon:yes gene_type:complete